MEELRVSIIADASRLAPGLASAPSQVEAAAPSMAEAQQIATQATQNLAQAQAQLADPKARILLGANTDQLLVSADRRKNDQCHFSESGQRKTASAYAAAIKDFHASHP